MADNSSIPVASGNETFANKDVGSVKYPRVLITWGTGTPVDASAAQPVPVAQQGNITIGTMPAVTVNALPAGTANIGDVDVLTVPADPFGVNGDAASVSTSISAKLRAIATTLGINVLSRGTTPSDANTLKTHTTVDPAQLAPLVVGSVQVITGGNLYIDIPASTSTAQNLSSDGSAMSSAAVGTSYLEHLVCNVTDPTQCRVALVDGGSSLFVALGPTIDSGIGTQHVALGHLNKNLGVFAISTQPGVTVRATGRWP